MLNVSNEIPVSDESETSLEDPVRLEKIPVELSADPEETTEEPEKNSDEDSVGIPEESDSRSDSRSDSESDSESDSADSLTEVCMLSVAEEPVTLANKEPDEVKLEVSSLGVTELAVRELELISQVDLKVEDKL